MPIGDTELPHWHVNMFRQRGSHENFLLQEMWNQSQGLRAVRLSLASCPSPSRLTNDCCTRHNCNAAPKNDTVNSGSLYKINGALTTMSILLAFLEFSYF